MTAPAVPDDAPAVPDYTAGDVARLFAVLAEAGIADRALARAGGVSQSALRDLRRGSPRGRAVSAETFARLVACAGEMISAERERAEAEARTLARARAVIDSGRIARRALARVASVPYETLRSMGRRPIPHGDLARLDAALDQLDAIPS